MSEAFANRVRQRYSIGFQSKFAMKNTQTLLEKLSKIQGKCSIENGIISFENGETVDLKSAAAQAGQEKLALDSLLNGMRDLGFGTDDDINGGDAVAAMSSLFHDVLTRVLGGQWSALATYSSVGAMALEACGRNFHNECAQYTREAWESEVSDQNTNLGYWDWVGHQAESDGIEISAGGLSLKESEPQRPR